MIAQREFSIDPLVGIIDQWVFLCTNQPVKSQLLIVVLSFLTDHAPDETADRSTAKRPDRTTTSDDGARNSACSGTQCGVLIPLRHTGTTSQDE